MKEERKGGWDFDYDKHIHGHMWHRYSVTVNQGMHDGDLLKSSSWSLNEMKQNLNK
jgi:hypothetical protein